MASLDDLITPEVARGIWADRDTLRGRPSAFWMLRRAADVLGIDQAEVDKLIGTPVEHR